MKYETKCALDAIISKIVDEESGNISTELKRYKDLYIGVSEKHKKLTNDTRNYAQLVNYRENMQILIDVLVKNGILKETGGDEWFYTPEWPVGEWWMSYEYEGRNFEIMRWGL